ncbi:uncharacterized protein [Macrobrachium rosenbergii]|uniref:uncharacterized protein n=1 Tax=Macrobrachium rosenbergii TaxID=79674 RepID=UPI0034D4BC3D
MRPPLWTLAVWLLSIPPASPSHFRGAVIMMRPTGSGYEREMEISFQIAWRRDSFYTMCDEDTINSLEESYDTLLCWEGCESADIGLTMAYYCTGFSREENWSFGGRTMIMNFTGSGSRGVLVFEGGDWLSPINAGWYVAVSNSLLKRNDTGKINSTPRVITAPVIKLKENCAHNISFPINDPDGDEVRCRWAQGYDECGGACDAFPNAVLDNETCVITYEAKFGSGIYVAAIMIEDFMPGSDEALSSISLQFVVKVYPSDQSCFDMPHFINPTLLSGSCVAVPQDTVFSTQLIAKSDREDADITEILTVSPEGFMKSPMYFAPDLHAFFVNISWSPSADQMNRSHSFCFTAVDSFGDTGIQNCITLMVGTKQPSIISVNINQDSFGIYEIVLEFDHPIQYPATVQEVNFKDYETNSSLYRIIIVESKQVTLTQPHTLIIYPHFNFPENRKVFMEIDRSIVVSPEGCNPGNEEIRDKNFVSFIPHDLRPPVATFIDAPSRTRENVTFTWTTDEPARSICSLDNLELVDCSSGIFNAENLKEGKHTLLIEYSDNSNNSANTSHTFYVDLTAPSIIFENAPAAVSNEVNFNFVFSCGEPENDCIFYCDFHKNFSKDTNFSLCFGNSFSTPTLENEAAYDLSVYAVDSVENVGKSFTYHWVVDLVSPTILANDSSVECSSYMEGLLSTAIVTDNMDPNPDVSYTDDNDPCVITRTWKATDHAGNTALLEQKVLLLFDPSLSVLPSIFVTCSDTINGKEFVPTDTATAPNPCGRPLDLSYTDYSGTPVCPGHFNRTWTLNDTCSGLHIQQEQIINLYSSCPGDACGQNYSEPHGSCYRGKCLCSRPWHGDSCGILIQEPIFKPVMFQSLLEYQDYETNIILLQGTEPVTLSLISAPERTRLEHSTRRLILQKAPAGNLTFTLSATNEVGMDEITVNAIVNTTYSPSLNLLSKTQFLKDEPVPLSGSVSYEGESPIRDTLNGRVPVVIDIENPSFAKSQMIEIFTDQNGQFSFPYNPGSLLYGKFKASARHPSKPKGAPQVEWEIPGMSTLYKSVSLYGETNGTYKNFYSNVTVLFNDGGSDLHQIQGKFGPNEYVHVIVTFGKQEGLVGTFEYGSQIALNIDLETSGPAYLKFPIVVESQENVKLLITVEVDIRQVLPIFQIDPPNVETAVCIGCQKMIEFKVTNLGKTSADNVSLIVPDSSYFTVSDFLVRENSRSNLGSQETAKASVLITIPGDKSLGMISGSFLVNSISARKEVPFSILVTSDNIVNLTIEVEDEYTYFAKGRPLVADATVTLTSSRLNIQLEGSTSGNNGSVTFFNVQEEMYEIVVEAPDHKGKKEIIIPSAITPTITIFIEREAVTIKWTVTQTDVEDVYDITLEADYKVNVPMPVVSITPNMIDVEDYELGLKDTIEFNVTNHGLIRADSVQISLPSEHPSLMFEFLSEVPESVEAKQSVKIQVGVSQRQRQKRSTTCTLTFLISLHYGFICGEFQSRTVPVLLSGKYSVLCQPSTTTDGPDWSGVTYDPSGTGRPVGPGGFFDFQGFVVSVDTSHFCDECLSEVFDCIPFQKLFKKLFRKVFKKYFPHVKDTSSDKYADSIFSITKCTIDHLDMNNIVDAVKYLMCMAFDVEDVFDLTPTCIDNVIYECVYKSIKISKREVSQDVLIKKIRNFVISFSGIISSIRALEEIFGDELWLRNGNSSWVNNVLIPVFQDSSELGIFVSSQELQNMKDSIFSDGINWDDKEKLVQRFNTTLANWQNGNLEPVDGSENMISYSLLEKYLHNISAIDKMTKDRGFSSYVEAFKYDYDALSQIEDINEEEGVCAVVRIQIKQRATLVREGFTATLEIENKEKANLENIHVQIIITNKETFEVATEKFAIGKPTLSGPLSGTDGNGTLPAESSGTSKWLIIPYSEAAPTKDEVYDIGGKLSYTSDGNQVEIPFLPTSVTVHPDPSLVVHYFWEKHVISDDPFTDEVEPAEPFSLGVMIKNEGFGTTYSLKITSSQPKIIENEKGLQISFQMISSMLGNEKIEPSLTVNFGDLLPNATKTARWWMTSSLIGTFIDYNATFENRNPLGDPKLSLIKKLTVHELIQNIIVPGDDDDGILDFLVNDDEDICSFPDKIYNSKDMSFMPVQVGKVTGIGYQSVNQVTTLRVDTKVARSGWNYFKVRSSLLENFPTGKPMKLSRQDGGLTISDRVSLPKENAWISVDVVSKKRKKFLNIVDYSGNASSRVSYFLGF